MDEAKQPADAFRGVVGQESAVCLLRSLKGSHMHLLLAGPPGTGKSTSAKCFVGSSPHKVINAASDLGIESIRRTVRNFVESKNLGDRRKFVILEEADAIGNTAQMALRHSMEAWSATTTFIIVCNYIENIDPAIVSRCQSVLFLPLSTSHLVTILSHHGFEGDAVQEAAKAAEGDARTALQFAQYGVPHIDTRDPTTICSTVFHELLESKTVDNDAFEDAIFLLHDFSERLTLAPHDPIHEQALRIQLRKRGL